MEVYCAIVLSIALLESLLLIIIGGVVSYMMIKEMILDAIEKRRSKKSQ